MKKLWNKWTEIALVKRILVGLVLGAILGLTVPGATGISILGDVFVSALKAIAPLLVFFLVISSLCNAGNSHGGVINLHWPLPQLQTQPHHRASLKC